MRPRRRTGSPSQNVTLSAVPRHPHHHHSASSSDQTLERCEALSFAGLYEILGCNSPIFRESLADVRFTSKGATTASARQRVYGLTHRGTQRLAMPIPLLGIERSQTAQRDGAFFELREVLNKTVRWVGPLDDVENPNRSSSERREAGRRQDLVCAREALAGARGVPRREAREQLRCEFPRVPRACRNRQSQEV
jgi:hypothetical protein